MFDQLPLLLTLASRFAKRDSNNMFTLASIFRHGCMLTRAMHRAMTRIIVKMARTGRMAGAQRECFMWRQAYVVGYSHLVL